MPCSLTISEAFAAARKAGLQTPDTGLFESFLERTGAESRGEFLKSRLKLAYEAAFEERFRYPAAAPAAIPARRPTPQELNLQFLERNGIKVSGLLYKGQHLYQTGDGEWRFKGDRESAFLSR